MSTAYQVDLVFGTRQADTQLARMEQRLRGIDQNAGRAGGQDAFGGLARGAQSADSKVAGLVRTMGQLAAAAGVGAAVTAVARLGIQAEQTQTRLAGLSKGYDDLNLVQEAARQSAARFGVSQQSAADGLAQTYGRLRPLGFTLSEITDIYDGFNTATRNAGASAAESEGAFRQLAQALGSGTLRGDEFNSIMEQAPVIGQEVAKVMGINAGKLRDVAAEGKITGDVVLKALQNIKRDGADQLTASLNTTGGSITRLQGRVEDLGATIGSALLPMIEQVATKAAEAIGLVTQMIQISGNSARQAKELEWQRGAEEYATKMYPSPFDVGRRQDAYQRFIEGKRADYDLANRPQLPAAQTRPPRASAPADGSSKTGSSGRSGSGSSGRSGSGSSSPDYPAYITANQMRSWLQSQGYERTSGDYTNKGHKTPNHMLNAIDTGELDGSYPFAVQRARDLQRRLAATGAFGNQLFGPNNDPRGHKDHVHIPTPGGRIKVTPGLAQMMGLGGKGSGGMAMQEAEWANDAAEKEAERQRIREDGLRTSGRQLEISRAELKIAQASTDEQQITATADKTRTERMYKYAELMRDAKSDEERINIARAQGLEIQRDQLEVTRALGDALVEVARQQEAAMRPRLDNIDMLEATLKGPSAVRALERRNAVGQMSAAGVDPAKAGELYDRERALERQVERQRELNSLWEEGGRTLGGLFSDLVRGTDDWQASLTRALESLATVLLQAGLGELAKNNQGGFLGGLLNSIMGSFDGGGYTGSGSRTGGLDGKGGFAAILHPNETVVDHTRGQGMGGAVTNNINVQVATDGSTKVDATGGGQLGRELEAAVTAVILRQRRPGGVLAGS